MKGDQTRREKDAIVSIMIMATEENHSSINQSDIPHRTVDDETKQSTRHSLQKKAARASNKEFYSYLIIVFHALTLPVVVVPCIDIVETK